MKRKSVTECIALIVLSVTASGVLYRQLTDSHPIPVYAASPPPVRAVEMPITDSERHIIRTYVSSHSGTKPGKILPPGLARIPASLGRRLPDWEKKLVKGEIMPTELYRECQPLPKDLTSRLPPPPYGTVLVAIDGRIVRMARASFEILDVYNTRF